MLSFAAHPLYEQREEHACYESHTQSDCFRRQGLRVLEVHGEEGILLTLVKQWLDHLVTDSRVQRRRLVCHLRLWRNEAYADAEVVAQPTSSVVLSARSKAYTRHVDERGNAVFLLLCRRAGFLQQHNMLHEAWH